MKYPTRLVARVISLAICIPLLAAPAAPGAILTWDADTLTAGAQDGVGTWSDGGAGWWDGGANVNFANGDAVTFGAGSGAAGTITLSGTVQTPSLTLAGPGSGTYTLAGGTALNFNGTANTIDAQVNALITALITRANPLLKTGPGIVALNSASTGNDGVFTIAQGGFSFNNVSAFGAAAANTITFGDAGTGADVLSLTFTEDNTASRTTVNNLVVSANGSGDVRLGRSSTLASGLVEHIYSGTLTLNRDVVLFNHSTQNPGGGQQRFTGAISGTGNIHIEGSVTNAAVVFLQGNGVNTFNGNLVFRDNGRVQVGTASAFVNVLPDTTVLVFQGINSLFRLSSASEGVGGLSSAGGKGSISLNAGSATQTLTSVVASATYEFTGTMDNGNRVLAFAKAGAGTQILSGTGSHSGTTHLLAGTLAIGSDSALGTGTLNLNGANAVFRAATAAARTVTNAVTLAQNTVFGSADTGDLLFTGNVAGGAARTLTISNSLTEFSGLLDGTGTRTKAGPGVLRLSGANTYSGVTLINEGTLALGPGGSIANSPSITNHATFDVSAVAGGYHLAAGKTLSGAGTVLGPLTVDAGATLTAGGATGTDTGVLHHTGDLTLNGTNLIRLRPADATNDVMAVSAGTLTLNGTLDVRLVNGTANTGDQFVLFHAPAISVGSVVLAGDEPATGMWDLSLLGSGILRVMASSAPPSLTTTLTNMTEPCSATLVAGATGSAPLVFVWSLDGVPYDFGTNLTSITITPASSATPHTVAVVVTNLVGTSAVSTASVTIEDTTAPAISLLGANPLAVPLGSPFVEPGVTATDPCGGSVTLATNDAVNTAVLGRYTNSYVATDTAGNSATNFRTVIVLDSFVWTNPAHGSWGDGANWSNNLVAGGFGVPADFSTLTLPPGGITVTLDGARTIGGLWFGDQGGAESWTLHTGSGGPLTVADASPPVIRVDNPRATLGAALAGTNGFIKRGEGLLVLATNNPFSGAVTVGAGTLRLGTNNAIPTANPIVLGDTNSGPGPVTLQVAPTSAAGLPVLLTSPLVVSSNAPLARVWLDNNPASTQAGAINGSITLQDHDLWLTNSGSQLVQINGQITGAGDLHVDNGSFATRARLSFNGNNFTGDIYLHSGGLQTGSGAAATVNAIPDTADVTLAAGTILGISVHDTMGALHGGAGAILGCNVAPDNTTLSLVLGANHHDGVYHGDIHRTDVGNPARVNVNVQLTKIGTGTQTFNGACSNTAPTRVGGGTLIVNGYFASAITVSNGATLGGGGLLNSNVAVQAGGTLAPGSGPGTLTLARDLNLDGILAAELDSDAAAADKVVAAGLALGASAQLTLTDDGTGILPLGTTFVLVENTSANPVAGTFPGLAEGAYLPLGSNVWRLSYTGGDGNDVTLTAANRAPQANPNGAATRQDVPVNIALMKLLANDTDADGDPLSIQGVSATSTNGGMVTLGATHVLYVPVTGFTGIDRFTYTIQDGRGGTATASVEINVVSGALPSTNQVTLETLPGGGVRLRFAGIPGFSYEIQRASTLMPADWTTLATRIAPLHGIVEYVDAEGLPTAFYRTKTP